MKDEFNPFLMEQYQKANGYKYVDFASKTFKNDYLEWLKDRKKQGYRYLDFLYEMNPKVLERTTAEIGKTEFDTLTEPFDTTIISHFEFKNIADKTRLIPAFVKVVDEELLLQILPQGKVKLVFLPKKINLLMTENPYTPYSISNWDTLHNSGNYDIIVGVYGSIYDKDIKEKLNLLKNIREKILFGDYKYNLNTDNDIYYAAIASDRKQKIK